jgi:tetratricopeptide (TPR) repeat protein
MGRYEEALADLSQAIDLDPTSDWAIASRGETYRAGLTEEKPWKPR